MFERYTEKARRVVFFSRFEAGLRAAVYIEPHHLLMGLLREDRHLFDVTLGSPTNADALLSEIQAQYALSDTPPATSVDLPLSHASKRILAFGAEESARLNHRHIGTGHLLLGLLREESDASKFLRRLGFELDPIREKFIADVPDPEPVPPGIGKHQPLIRLVLQLPESKITRAEELLRNLLRE